MRSSHVRSRLRQGKVARIVSMHYPCAMLPAHAAKVGFDAVWLDTEHGTWDGHERQRLMAMHHLADIDCIVRTGSRNPAELYHLLEDGATGLMIPFVNSATEAAALVQAVKFPPAGQRGLDGAGLDNAFYLAGTAAYPKAANAETLLIVQIETPAAIAAIEQIAATPGVDALFIGPGDLSLRLGCPSDWRHPKLQAAMESVAAAAARHNVAWGCPAASTEDIALLAQKGAKLIAHGGDFMALMKMLPVFAQTLQDGLGTRG